MKHTVYKTENGPVELIHTVKDYHIFISQSDLELLMVEPKDENDKYQKVTPIVIKGQIPFKKMNGNILRKQKLLKVPDFYKIFIINGVTQKLFPNNEDLSSDKE